MVDLDKIYYIFYTPGSCGTLLSILIKSQIDSSFIFSGFHSNNAHQYKQNAIANTHSYFEYKHWLENGPNIEQHLRENQQNDSQFQRCHPQWINAIKTLKYPNLILGYLSNFHTKANNLYIKEKDYISNILQTSKVNFGIDSNHKNADTLMLIKFLKLYTDEEQKHFNTVKTVDMNRVMEKDYTELSHCVQITDREVLDEIIDEYNTKQEQDMLPETIKNYLKKHHNSI